MSDRAKTIAFVPLPSKGSELRNRIRAPPPGGAHALPIGYFLEKAEGPSMANILLLELFTEISEVRPKYWNHADYCLKTWQKLTYLKSDTIFDALRSAALVKGATGIADLVLQAERPLQ